MYAQIESYFVSAWRHNGIVLLLVVACLTLLLGWVIGHWRASARVNRLWELREVDWRYQQAECGRQLEDRNATLFALQDQVMRLEQELDHARATVHQRDIKIAEQQTAAREYERSAASEKSMLESAREVLAKDFEILSNRLFEAKQEQFAKSSRLNLEQVIGPFQTQLKDFYQRVEQAQKSDTAQRNQLLGQISELQKQSQQISLDAVNLTNALKGNKKVQGNWGEVILARLLEQAGLQQGREYQVQVSKLNAEGQRLQPDVIVYLPHQKHVVIDSKVSLIGYEKYINGATEPERADGFKNHVEAIRNHIKGLAVKRYDELLSVDSLDFVFMFIPIEGAFSDAVQNEPQLLRDAYERNIVLVGPSSLMVALRTIEALWKRERQDRNVERMVAIAGKLHDQFVLFVESLHDIGGSLQRAEGAYELALKRLCEGRGNLVKRAEELRQLGAKTGKRLPQSLAEQAWTEAVNGSASDNSENS